MASISQDPNGRRRILFVGPDRKRKTIRLGKISQRAAEAVKYRVEQLLAAKLTGHALEADTACWVAELSDDLVAKLARAELILSRERQVTTTLQRFLEDYIVGRKDVEPSTKLVWGHTERNLLQFFGDKRDINAITPGDADQFKQWLIGHEYASTTIHKRLQFARTFFRAMLRRKLLGNTPAIALKHYLMTTDEHFDKAVNGDREKATQKATQHTHAMGRKEPQEKSVEPEKPRELQGFAPSCETVQNAGLEDRGLEPLTFWLPARRSPN